MQVVLAQRVELRFDASLDPLHLLLRLLEVLLQSGSAHFLHAAQLTRVCGCAQADDAAIAQDWGGSPRTSGARHAYIFLLQLDAEAAFMGCTPEKLFKLERGELSTEALAGTRPRGDTAEHDQRLAHEVCRCIDTRVRTPIYRPPPASGSCYTAKRTSGR